MSDKKHVTIYTRGVASPRGGGYGVLLLSNGHRKELSGGEVSASNNRMDLAAAVELEIVDMADYNPSRN